MSTDINSYVTIEKQNSGKVQFICSLENKENIYQQLYSWGYRKSKLNNKQVYYRRQNNEIIWTTFDNIKFEFLQHLKKDNFSGIPDGIKFIDILNWYHKEDPIKERNLSNILSDTMTEDEEHSYRLQIDPTYKHRINIQHLLSKLNEWKFSKTTDNNTICRNSPLYYKIVDSNKYLVFTHYNAENKDVLDGFDCWMAIYENEKQVGKKAPVKLEKIKLSFDLSEDFHRIEKYVSGDT